MPRMTFAPGVHLSATDVVVLVSGAIGAPLLWTITWWWGFVIGFVVAHFFVFCNVVRLSRSLEFVWGGTFATLAAATIAADFPGWPATGAISLGVTVLVVLIEMRKPSYHGIGWQKINPGLPAWWEAHVAATEATRIPDLGEKK